MLACRFADDEDVVLRACFLDGCELYIVKVNVVSCLSDIIDNVNIVAVL